MHPLFSLDNITRSKIIALGIRKQRYYIYQRSRDGRNLFHFIDALINKVENGQSIAKTNISLRAINHSNLITIGAEPNNSCTKWSEPKLFATQCALINCRSVVNKTVELKTYIITNNLDVCILTKTWIRMDDSINEVQMCPTVYKVYSVPRKDRSGEGIAVIYRDSIPITENSVYDYMSMECVDFTVTLLNNTINLSVIYRLPDRSVLSFADGFLNYIESNINSAGKNLFVGDFNIHVKDQSNSDTRHFQDVLDSFGLINHIGFDTHHLENALDLVITSARDNFIRNPYQGHLFSDHNINFL